MSLTYRFVGKNVKLRFFATTTLTLVIFLICTTRVLQRPQIPRSRTVPEYVGVGIGTPVGVGRVAAVLDQHGVVPGSVADLVVVPVVAAPERTATPGRGGGAEGSVSGAFEIQSTSRFGADYEAGAEFRTHQVVEDRIYGRVQVDHYPAEVEDVVVPLHAQSVHAFLGYYNNPQRKHPEGYQTQEKAQHHRAQHEDDLPPGPYGVVIDVLVEHHGGGVGNEVFGDDAVQHEEDDEGDNEEEENTAEEVQGGPERVG